MPCALKSLFVKQRSMLITRGFGRHMAEEKIQSSFPGGRNERSTEFRRDM